HRRDQLRVRGDAGEIDVMDEVEEMAGFDPVIGHQPGEGGAVGVEIILLHLARRHGIEAGQLLDVEADPLVNELEQIAAVRIEAVVEIEDPDVDMSEAGVHGHALTHRPPDGKALYSRCGPAETMSTARSRVGRQLRWRTSNCVGPVRRTASPRTLMRAVGLP